MNDKTVITEIEISRHALIGMDKLAGVHDVRHYLNGVSVETSKEGVFVVATDGHLLGALKLSSVKQPDSQTIIPSEVIKKIQRKGDNKLLLTVYEGKRTADLADGDQSMSFAPIDGRFPEWRMVLPTKFNNVGSQINPNLLYRMSEAMRVINGLTKRTAQIPHVWWNGPNGAVCVTTPDNSNLIGVIMPYKSGEPHCTWHSLEFAKPEAKKTK